MADLQLYKVDLTTPVPVEPGQPQRYGDDPKTSFTKHNDAMDAIEAALNDSETGSGEIDTRLTAAEGEIDTLQTDVSAAQISIAGLGSALTAAEGEIDDLQSGLSTAQTDLGQAESDINSLQSGLAEAYKPSNILGTVSQAAGVPTGAVIERGSNANGEYVRFADGAQICTMAENAGPASSTATGSIYTTGTEYFWTFPAVFATAPNVVASVRSSTTVWAKGRPTSPTQGALRLFSSISISTSQAVEMTAIGRWF